MTFEVGSLAASLRIDGLPQFEGELQRAGNALDRAGQRGASFGRAGAAAVRNAAGATVALTGAATAYLAILTRTGVQYNSLQQNSRAALSTLLGGMEQANAQMDRLDAFAKQSPFSKSVFVGAQQQLISFGLEAQKVIPYLDAVQNAIAGSGGSNADLEAVVTTMAKIKSSAKLTAQDFIEFGNRGINAAELIGSQMGKTGAEIRAMVTDGKLEADAALDALTAGMSEKFGGATAKIKEQWSGAVDRIKAANRDIGSTIAEPFVSKNGGGMAVMWGNQVADVLRAIEKQAVPVMQILTNRGMPMFANLTGGLDSIQRIIQSWDSSKLEVFFDKLGQHAPTIGLVAGYLGALGMASSPLGPIFGMLGLKMNPVVGAFAGLAATSPELRSALQSVLVAAQPLGDVFGDVAKILSGQLVSILPVVSSGLGLLASGVKPLVGLLESIPAPLLAGVAAFIALRSATSGFNLGPLNANLVGFFSAIKQSDAIRAFNSGLSPTSALLAGVGQAGGAAKAGVQGLGQALQTAFLTNPVGVAITAVSVAIGLWATANATAQQRVQEHKDRVSELRSTLDEASASLTQTSRDMVAQSVSSNEMAEKLDKIGVSGQAYTQALIDGGAAAEMFQKSMVDSAKAALEASGDTDKMRGYADRLGISYEDLISVGLDYEKNSHIVADAMRQTGADASDMSDAFTIAQAIMNNQLGTHTEVASSYQDMSRAIAEAKDEQNRINEAIANARVSMSDAGRATDDYNVASAAATDQTAALEERVRSLKTAYDILNGSASSTAEAHARVDASNLALSEGFKKLDEDGRSMWKGAIDKSAEATNYIDTSTRAGQELFRALQDQQNNTLQAAITARDTAINQGESAETAFNAAKEAAQEYNDGLSKSLEVAGITGRAHDRLMEKWSVKPDVAAFTVTDNGTMDELTLQAMQLAIQIEATPDRTIEIDEPNSPEIIERLETLGYKVEQLKDKKIRVSETGADEVNNKLDRIARTRTATINVQEILTGKTQGWQPGAAPREVNSATGNMFSGGAVQAFASGGFAPGFYRAPAGQAAIHKFAERELEWEAYISPKPGFRDRNIQIGMDALRRLGEPVVPISALRGIPGFATGKMVGMTPTSAPPTSRQAAVPSGGRGAPLVGNVFLGQGATPNDFRELKSALDWYDRGAPSV